MKQENTSKKRAWLWIVIAVLAALLLVGGAIAGVVMLLMGGNGNEGTETINSKLYWNVDKTFYTQNSETGLTTREPEEDGLYHVRLATGGEIVEVLVSDGRLINFIDTLDALGLVFDADGMVVDALDPSVFNPEIVRDFFVKRVTDTQITVNSSVAMNGMDMTFDISAIGLYDVSATAAQPGMPATCGVMDRVFIYGDMEGNPTDLFITVRADSAEVYWPLGTFWNKTTKETTRVPDENGVYTIQFAHKGEVVELKCKSKSLVSQFDKTDLVDRTYALKFDEEGYIVGTITTQMAIKGMRICDRFDVEGMDGNSFYAKSHYGNTLGQEVNSTMRDDCEVYLVCDNGTVKSHIGEKTELQMGDRILCFADVDGNAKLIYVLNRRVDSKLYFNIYPKNISQATFTTLRKPDENGYYNFTLACEGKVKKYRTKDIDLATFLDKQECRGVGLKLRGDIIEGVYEQESVFGIMVGGIGRYVTAQTGNILSIALAHSIASPANLVMTPDCKVYNVTTDRDGTAIASETTLREFDQVICFRNYQGLTQIYVIRRYRPDATVYWNTEAKMNSDYTDTSRTTNSEGYYVFTMTSGGKKYTIKTKDRETAYFMESRTNKLVALKTKKDPNHPDELIVKYAYDARSIVKAGYYTADSYYYDYLDKSDNRLYMYYIDGAGEKQVGNTKIYNRKGLTYSNISNGYESYKGETTKLKKHDKVFYLVSQIDWVAHSGYIKERKFDAPVAYSKARAYNSTTKQTTRTPDADGYYVFDLTVDGKVGKYKTKDITVASKVDSFSGAFTLVQKNGIITGAYSATASSRINAQSVGRADVTTIKGSDVTFTRNRPTSSDYGSVYERKLAKNCVIVDLSPYAAKWGETVKLGLGDRVEAYANKDGELVYIFIVYRCTRKEGPISYCDHCNKKVWWEPYVGERFNVSDIHYYFPTDVDGVGMFTIGADVAPVVGNGTSVKAKDHIFAYSGVKLEGKVMGEEITVYDNNPVAEKANKQKFPSDGLDHKAMCYVCNKEVTWKAMTNAVWQKAYDASFNTNDAENPVHSHFYVPKDFDMVRTDKPIVDNWSASTNSTMCIHLNGKTINSKAQINIQKGIINIMGTGTLDVSCTGAADYSKGTLYLTNSAGKLYLYGGTYINTSSRRDDSYVFDMNGKQISSSFRIASVNSKLDIFDTAGGGAITVTSGKDAYGGLIAVNKGGTLNLHSGTLKMDSPDLSSTGGVVYVATGGTFNMLGGKITNGAAAKGGNVAVSGVFNMKKGTITNGSAATGSNVYAYMGGTINMTGGKIVDNQAGGRNVYISDSVFNLKDGTISTANANVTVMGNSAFNMTGGTVSGGKAENGGNFYLQSSSDKKDKDGNQAYGTLNLSGGKITGGTGTASAGNVYIMPYGKLNQTGGTIENGTAPVGGNISMGSTNARMILSGTIKNGEVQINKNGTTTLAGKVNIDNLKVDSGCTVALDNLDAAKAKINVDATGAFTVANEKASDYKACFEPIDAVKHIEVKADNIMYCDETPTECPICHAVTTWRKISENGNRISGTLGVKHWIIDKDVTYTDNIANAVIYNNTASLTMCIDMNGKTLTSHNGIQANNGTINLFGGGTFINTSESTSESIGVTALYIGNTATVNLSDNVVVKSADPADSAVLFAGTTPTLNLSSGAKLDGDVVVKTGSKPTLNINGGIITGTAKMYQGTTVLDGAANVNRIETGVQGMLNVKSTFTGTAVVDFPVYEAIDAEPGYGYAYTFNATVDGAFTGTLMNSEGKQFAVVATDVGGTTVYRLKVETTKTKLTGNEIAAAAETMEFPSGVDNNTVVTAFCPACNKVVDWKAIKGNNQRILMNRYANAHLFMSDNMTKTNVNASGDYAIFASSHKEGGEHNNACLHFNGKTYTANSEIQIDTGSATVKKMTMSLMGKGKFVTDLSTTNNSFNRSILRVGANTTASSMNVYSVTLVSTHPTKPGISYYGANGVLNLYGQTTITVPETATELGGNVMGHFNDYRYTLVNGVLTVTGAKATESPAWLAQKDSITKIVLGEKVTTVAAGAFKDCANVTNVVMTNKLTAIGNDAFAGCTGIEKAEYFGEEPEWAAVTVGTGNEPLTSKIICHVHNYTTVVTPATCTEGGYTTYTCSCGYTYKGDEVAAKGHGTANAEGKCPDCNMVVNVSDYAKKMTFPTDGTNSEQLCPHCNKVVVWKPATSGQTIFNDHDHYYLTASYTITTDKQPTIQMNKTTTNTLCVHLNGKTVNNRAGIVLQKTAVMNLMGDGAVINDNSSTGGWGDFGIRLWYGGTINIYGGRYETKGNKPMLQFSEIKSAEASINLYGDAEFVYAGSWIGHRTGSGHNQSLCSVNDYR